MNRMAPLPHFGSNNFAEQSRRVKHCRKASWRTNFLGAKKTKGSNVFLCKKIALMGQGYDKTWTRKQAYYTMIVTTRVKYTIP
jgi:hypothetical protein